MHEKSIEKIIKISKEKFRKYIEALTTSAELEKINKSSINNSRIVSLNIRNCQPQHPIETQKLISCNPRFLLTVEHNNRQGKRQTKIIFKPLKHNNVIFQVKVY